MPKHRGVFLVYMPQGNLEAMVHYRDTIENRVPLERVRKYLTPSQLQQLNSVFAGRPMAIWGSKMGPQNRARFDRMAEKDHLLIVEGPDIRFMGQIALKVVSPELSRELWSNFQGTGSAGWDLIYFIANARELGVPFVEFCQLFGYQKAFQLRGFTSVSDEKLDAFYDRYDDLYSILVRIREGERILVKPTEPMPLPPPPPLAELEPGEIDKVVNGDNVSDHVRMQFKLARLGLKAGQKVWVPVNDQERLRRHFEFNEFERQFSAGVDLPPSYVENIDVVWKEEFRIDAAFEVENSTAIYSGLLRFADLSIVAPNTIYPMFIVAPIQRRGQVRSQLLRPAFRRLNIADKVRFLPYEAIDEIDEFFKNTNAGLTVDLVKGKAEVLA